MTPVTTILAVRKVFFKIKITYFGMGFCMWEFLALVFLTKWMFLAGLVRGDCFYDEKLMLSGYNSLAHIVDIQIEMRLIVC